MTTPPASPLPENFHTTRWTQVAQARGVTPEAKAALSDLCAAYYTPVHAFIRCWCRDHHQADDLTQEFFARLLAKNSLDGADEALGKFRTYLLGAVKHFLLKMHDAEHTRKRGGGMERQSLDATQPIPETQTLPPDAQFDRDWALAVLDQALRQLETDFESEGKAAQFQILKPWLTGTDHPQSTAAQALDMSETAIKVAIHRLRQRFRQLIRNHLARTLVPQADVDEEMRHLLAALVD